MWRILSHGASRRLKPCLWRAYTGAVPWRRRSAAAIAILFVTASLSTLRIGATEQPHETSQAPEAGVSVYFNSESRLSPATAITQSKLVFEYLVSLGANAVSLDIPFYEAGATKSNGRQTASAVTSGIGTPSPSLLASIVRMAEGDGLRVQLRPLLSEVGDDQAAGVFRGTIAPANPSAWLTSYESWLRPYLYVAQATGVNSFSIGAELTTLVTGTPQSLNAHGAHALGAHNDLPYWVPLVQTASEIYHGAIIYSGSHATPDSVPGTGFGFDAYGAISVAGKAPAARTTSSAVVAAFLPKIIDNYKIFETAPTSQERIEEIGIPAVAGAWHDPWFYEYPKKTPLARWVQADWITASCDAFNDLHMQGFYLWAIDLNSFVPLYNADASHDFNSWQGTAAVPAIKACFDSIRARA